MLAILKGMQRTMEARDAAHADANAQRDHTLAGIMTAMDGSNDSKYDPTTSMPATRIPKQDGGSYNLQFHIENFKKTYRDEYAGDELPHELVRKSWIEKLSDGNTIVRKLVHTASARASCPGYKPIRTRGVTSKYKRQ